MFKATGYDIVFIVYHCLSLMLGEKERNKFVTGFMSWDYRRTVELICFSEFFCGYSAEETPACADVEIEDLEGAQRLTKSQRRRLQKERKRLEMDAYHRENEARNVYPTDLWFLIGRFVPPESVRTFAGICSCLLYTSPSPRDATLSRMPSSA